MATEPGDGATEPGDGVKVAHELDALGLLCPLPVLKARKRLKGLASGEVMAILSDDPVARIDVPNLCREDGHALLSVHEIENGWRFLLRKG